MKKNNLFISRRAVKRRRSRRNHSKLLLFILCITLLISGGVVIALILTHSGSSDKSVQTNNEIPLTTSQTTSIAPTKVVATPEPTPTLVPTSSAVLAFTGDLMVHSYQYQAAYDSATKTYDFSNNFTEVEKYFASADYVVGNLETTLGGDAIGARDYPRFNTPDSFADAIKAAGFNLVSTANNHCCDQGSDALCRTIDYLDEIGLSHVGTYKSKAASKKIFVTDINGISVAFLSCTYGINGMSVANEYNVSLLNDSFYKKIRKARKMADFVIILPHNGTEYASTPSDTYRQQYYRMLDAGADAIIASHPHVLQETEYRTITEKDGSTRTGFIMYSMGNFISSQTTRPRDAGTILKLTITCNGEQRPSIDQVDVIPTWCRFTDASGKRNFTVFSVYDVLKMPESKRRSIIRDNDYNRVLQIQTESTQTMLGTAIPVEQAKKKYKIKP